MYGATSATSCQPAVVEPPEDPAVDLLQRLRVLLLHERLHGGQERDDRDAGEHERRRAAAAAAGVAEHVGERRRRAPAPRNAASGSRS